MANTLQLSQEPVPGSTKIRNGSRPLNEKGAGLRSTRSGAASGLQQSVDSPEGPDRNEEGRLPDFDGSFSVFLRELRGSRELSEELGELLFTDAAAETAEIPGGSGELQDFLQSVSLEEPEAVKMLLEQQSAPGYFGGPLFQGLRELLRKNISRELRGEVMDFTKACYDRNAGPHLLRQMHSIAEDLRGMLLKSGQTEFDQLTEQMNWEAQPGDTSENTEVLNSRVIPFLSGYISRMHDYGAVRSAALLFILYTVNYENGSRERVERAFQKLLDSREFRLRFPEDDPRELWRKTQEAEMQSMQREGAGIADRLAAALRAGAEGRLGSERTERFQNLLRSMLIHESVHIPLRHLLIPFSYGGRAVVSEFWISMEEPSGAPRREGQLKLLLKFSIQDLGSFDMVVWLQERNAELTLYIPETLMKEKKEISRAVTDILRKNGFHTGTAGIFRRDRALHPEEVFPEIGSSRRSVNRSV